MQPERFVLRFRGGGQKPEADVRAILELPEVTLVDGSSTRMLLVEGPEPVLKAAVDQLPGWVMIREVGVPMPDPRKRIGES